jgi:predicted alpha/beta-hydrolase family hydrolase
MRHAFLVAISQALADRKIATLRWEFAFMTAGRGRPPRAADAEAEVRMVWDAIPIDLPRYGGGKSFGGRMTSRAHAASSLSHMRGLIFLGFPLHPAGRPGIDRAEHLSGVRCPMLFVQGDRDALADPALVGRVIAKLPSATLHALPGADHALDRRRDIVEIADAIDAWIPPT